MKRFFTSRNFELQTRMPTPPNSDEKNKKPAAEKKARAPAKKDNKVTSANRSDKSKLSNPVKNDANNVHSASSLASMVTDP